MEQACDNASPFCSQCENAMQRIGKMPRFGLHPAFHVFRCDGCKVVSDHTAELTLGRIRCLRAKTPRPFTPKQPVLLRLALMSPHRATGVSGL
jgi:hypothetical protein